MRGYKASGFPAVGILLIIAGFQQISCSTSDPVNPYITSTPLSSSDTGNRLLGIFRVIFDLENETVEYVPLRTPDKHWNITNLLVNPNCQNCFKVHLVSINTVQHTITADVTLLNYTSALNAYDLRGIVYSTGDYALLNPHAYTLLHAPGINTDPAGFRAFATGLPNRILPPGESATETFVIKYPPGSGILNLVYAIDVSWPSSCPEAYDITDFTQDPLGAGVGDSTYITVDVMDWQNNTKAVFINTDTLGGLGIPLELIGGDTWGGNITNIDGVPPGKYPCMITAMDTDVLIQLYQWVDVTVMDITETDPPVWDSDIGITAAWPGLSGILVDFGTATDISEPVTYNLYWIDSDTLDFGTANLITGIDEPPYLLDGLSAGIHTLCVRAIDLLGNETTNSSTMSCTVGDYPGVLWTEQESLETARMYAGGFIAEGYFWVMGGNIGGTLIDSVERFDLVEEIWDTPWNLPAPRDSFGCGYYNGYAHIFGGRFAETNVTSSCEIIHLETGDLTITPPVLPVAVAGMGSAWLDGAFYLAGGRSWTGSNWEYHNQVFSFNPVGYEFSEEANLGLKTTMFGFASGENFLMACGGVPGLDDVLYYEPGSGSWEPRSAMPHTQSQNCAVIIDGWLFSIGGDDGWFASNEVLVMDIADDTWYTSTPMKFHRFGATVATDGEKIYVAGGGKFVGPAILPVATCEIGTLY